MASTVRRLDAARRATVRICDRRGTHHGNGLLLDLEGEGVVVLTCHHVVARLSPEELSIATRRDDGSMSEPRPARYDAARSRPASDAVVLRVDGTEASQRPFLHALNPEAYAGTLPGRAIGLSHWQTDTFDARVATSTRLEVAVDQSGVWPDPPQKYVLPGVLRLADPTDARPGISGSPVVYEDGVLGLAHFSRAAGTDFERELYLVPLAVWARDWPALARLIEPLVDARLRATATVKRATSLEVERDVVMARFRADIYVEPPALSQARAALAAHQAVLIVGRPKSGKTRLAWQLLQEQPDALVVLPRRALPPESFETSSFAGRAVILFFDDLHRAALTYDPLEWRSRFDEASGGHCAIVCTCRDGSDWRSAREASRIASLLSTLERDCYAFTSSSEEGGRDLTESEGLRLAEALALSQDEFKSRFDGTPGSLTLDLSEMRLRYRLLRDEFRGDVSMSRLLDSAKMLYEASQPQLRVPVLRAVAERVRGDRPLSPEIWDTLQRRTREEGFGHVEATTEQLQIYKPYLEECVDYSPSPEELERLVDILSDAPDYEGLEHLGQALFMRYHANAPAEKAVRAAMAGGSEGAGILLGWILSGQPDRAAEVEQFYQSRIAAGRDSWINFGSFLTKLPGRAADAEAAYREAIRTGNASEVALGHWSLANLLSGQSGREAEVEAGYRYAAEHGVFMGGFSLAHFLADQLGRESDAEAAARAAVAGVEKQMAAIQEQQSKFEKNPARSPGEMFSDYLEEAWFDIGKVVYRDPNRQPEAEDAFRRAANLGSARAAVNLGTMLAARPEGEAEAEVMFRKAMAAGLDGGYYYLAILLMLQPGREPEAESVLREALDAGHKVAHLPLGKLLCEQPGRQDEAEQELRRAIAAGDPAAWSYLGNLLSSMEGRRDDAVEAYRQAAAQGDSVSLYNLGLLLTNSAPDQAAEAFRDAAEAGVAAAFDQLGGIYLAQDRLEEAEAAFRAGLEAGVTEAQLGLATIYLMTDRVEQGIELLQQAKAAGIEGAATILDTVQQERE